MGRWLMGGAVLLAALGCGRRMGTLPDGPRKAEDPGILTGGPIGGDARLGEDAGPAGDTAGLLGDARAGDIAGPGGDPGGGGDAPTGGDGPGSGDGAATGGDTRSAGDTRTGDTSSGDTTTGDTTLPGSGDVWVEVSYRYRSPSESATTASWSYSNTPGFTAADWAPDGDSWPYIHAPDGSSLVSDPIGGTVLELGCNERFRLFFGLGSVSFSSATVTVEGRSRATSSSVDFEVWNPGGGAFIAQASMSNDWNADTVVVSFDAVPGDGFQAVELSPYARSCNLAVRRVRLTLHDAW